MKIVIYIIYYIIQLYISGTSIWVDVCSMCVTTVKEKEGRHAIMNQESGLFTCTRSTVYWCLVRPDFWTYL